MRRSKKGKKFFAGKKKRPSMTRKKIRKKVCDYKITKQEKSQIIPGSFLIYNYN